MTQFVEPAPNHLFESTNIPKKRSAQAASYPCFQAVRFYLCKCHSNRADIIKCSMITVVAPEIFVYVLCFVGKARRSKGGTTHEAWHTPPAMCIAKLSETPTARRLRCVFFNSS